MILGTLLICVSPIDAGSCMPIPNATELFESMEVCEAEANAVAKVVSAQYFVKAYCFETDFFELL